ncbi:MAG TPA: hypothetical protein VI248_17470 [Kineosporiaceae bacterium]
MRRKKRVAGLGASLGVGLVAAFCVNVTVARAGDDTPTSLELVRLCNKGTDFCQFHPSGSPTLFAGDAHQIGSTVFNCGPGTALKSVSWTDSSSESNSIGVSFVNATEGEFAGLLGAFKTEFAVTYGHRWGSSDSTTRATDVKVAAGGKGWLVRAAPMQRISGTFELHFKSRFSGHYYWYVPFTITGPAPDATNIETVIQREGPMTSGEGAQCA